MIAYLEGILAEKKPFSAVIDVNGVGYLTLVSLSTYEKLPERGQRVRLLTHTHVREDAFILFGFASPEEKEMFQILLGVSGIGPKSALAILSSISTRDLQQCIIDENLDVLTRISGIGRKTAQRLIVELKEKLQKSEVLTRKSANVLPKGEAMDEALAALLSLGYERSEANEALKRVASVKKKLTAEELVKQALSSNSIARIARH